MNEKKVALSLAIVGSGGDGVMTCGEAIVRAVARAGLQCLMLKSYGPQIRGGESACQIRVGNRRIFAPPDQLDVLLVFDWKDFPIFRSELKLRPGGVVVEEGEPGEADAMRPLAGRAPDRVYRVPFTRLSKEASGGTQARNMVALGALGALFRLPLDQLESSIRYAFTRHGEKVIEANLAAFRAGRDYAIGRYPEDGRLRVPVGEQGQKRIVITGNEAVAYGALLAGCRFFAGYPITPSSEIMEWLSVHMPGFGGTMVQTEDEIAALGMVLGASLVGTKAMTATSGPGLSLMTELLGLASIAEIPSVIVNVMRAGPSTGMPTKSEQSDLMHAIYGGHGDTPRVVMAPCDVGDCFDVMREAFFVSEKFQLPVIVLSDADIGQCKTVIPEPDVAIVRSYEREHPRLLRPEDYKRFEITESGVSPMSVPGMDNIIYRAAGLEHAESGAPASDYKTHQAMNEKRYRKLRGVVEESHFMRRYGPERAEVGIIAWGSTKGAVRETVELLGEQGFSVNALVPQVLYPLDVEQVRAWLAGVGRLLVVELSFSRQFLQLLMSQLELPPGAEHYGRSGGKPLTVEELEQQVRKLLISEREAVTDVSGRID